MPRFAQSFDFIQDRALSIVEGLSLPALSTAGRGCPDRRFSSLPSKAGIGAVEQIKFPLTILIGYVLFL